MRRQQKCSQLQNRHLKFKKKPNLKRFKLKSNLLSQSNLQRSMKAMLRMRSSQSKIKLR